MTIRLIGTAVSLILVTTLALHSAYEFSKTVVPIQIDSGKDRVQNILSHLGLQDRKDLARAFRLASDATGLKETLLIALMTTESSGNQNIISVKGYAGLMQVPQGPQWRVSAVNVMAGAFILKEKLRYTSGDLEKAILFYKGYPDKDHRGRQQVNKVMRLFAWLEEKERRQV